MEKILLGSIDNDVSQQVEVVRYWLLDSLKS